jgi:hypothetical protein
MLPTVLIARGALNLVFALYFLIVPASDAAQNFQQSGAYLAADGLVALLIAGILLRARYPAWLTTVASVDALARVLLGLWFLLVPELHSFVTTRIFVLVIICLFALVLGAAGILMPLGLRLRGALSAAAVTRPSHWPLVLASAALVVFALALVSVFPDTAKIRILLGVYVLTLSVALLSAGLRRASIKGASSAPGR